MRTCRCWHCPGRTLVPGVGHQRGAGRRRGLYLSTGLEPAIQLLVNAGARSSSWRWSCHGSPASAAAAGRGAPDRTGPGPTANDLRSTASPFAYSAHAEPVVRDPTPSVLAATHLVALGPQRRREVHSGQPAGRACDPAVGLSGPARRPALERDRRHQSATRGRPHPPEAYVFAATVRDNPLPAP
ncbi:hypothetical protein HBB16_05130 [Pseudonocardia sp. MCCB 268]|nr:hypothetical protein [Pseudonocardia cytotoxica]